MSVDDLQTKFNNIHRKSDELPEHHTVRCKRCEDNLWCHVVAENYIATLSDEEAQRPGVANSVYPCPKCRSGHYEAWTGSKLAHE